MNDKLKSNVLHLLEAEKSFSTALYAGPGLEPLVASLSGTLAERIVAFTVPTSAQSLLRSSFAEPSQIEYHAALLSEQSGAAKVQNFNIGCYSSLRSATGLKQLFPGLRETTQIDIDTISAEDALELASLRGNNNLLILGAFGCEMDILNVALSTEGTQTFARIILMVPEIAMFEGGFTGDALSDRLEQASYRRVWTDRSDPDMPIAAFDLDISRSADRAALVEREQSINALGAKLDQLMVDINNIQSQRDVARTETAKALQERDQARELAQDLDQKKEALKAELAEAQAKIAAELDEVSALRSQRNAANERLQELEQFIETLKAEHQAALARTFDEMSALRQNKEKAEDDLSLALRLQSLREADLSELRTRYRSLRAENVHMAELLRNTVHNLTFLQKEKYGGKKAAKRS